MIVEGRRLTSRYLVEALDFLSGSKSHILGDVLDYRKFGFRIRSQWNQNMFELKRNLERF